VDYSGIYHNTGCSILFGVKLKDFGYDVEPLSFTYIRHYKWYYSGVVDRWCHFLKMVSVSFIDHL
jgi:hypothetical protein